MTRRQSHVTTCCCSGSLCSSVVSNIPTTLLPCGRTVLRPAVIYPSRRNLFVAAAFVTSVHPLLVKIPGRPRPPAPSPVQHPQPAAHNPPPTVRRPPSSIYCPPPSPSPMSALLVDSSKKVSARAVTACGQLETRSSLATRGLEKTLGDFVYGPGQYSSRESDFEASCLAVSMR